MLKSITKGLLLITIMSLGYFSQAQCVPDMNFTTLGAHPANLPSICDGIAYDETITIVIERDWASPFGTVNFDSVYFTSVTGMPSGIVDECGTDPCKIIVTDALAYGCIRISGTTSEVGNHTISISYDAYVSGFKYSPDPITNDVEVFAATAPECVGTGIFDTAPEASFQLFPNPVADNTVEFSSEVSNVQVFNNANQKVSVSLDGQTMDISNLTNGMYLVKTDQGTVKLFVD